MSYNVGDIWDCMGVLFRIKSVALYPSPYHATVQVIKDGNPMPEREFNIPRGWLEEADGRVVA